MKYNLFGKNTGLYVSEVILGAANFGTRKGYGADPQESKKILSAYQEAGGNFIDISDVYQLGEAEEIVGNFLGKKRNDFIICSKYTRSSEVNASRANQGNHRKSMKQALEASLRRLKTDHIDIYMPHFDDGVTPLEEIITGLEDLVREGKILYAGLTNFPAWKVSSVASQTKLTAIQFEYNLLERTSEREIVPMADEFGLGKMIYSPLAGGILTGKYRKGEQGRINVSGNDEYSEDEKTKKIIDLLEEIGKEVNAFAGQVAFAWALKKDCFPLIGARKLSHFEESLQATNLELAESHIKDLDNASKISLGYPHDLLNNVRGTN